MLTQLFCQHVLKSEGSFGIALVPAAMKFGAGQAVAHIPLILKPCKRPTLFLDQSEGVLSSLQVTNIDSSLSSSHNSLLTCLAL